MKGTPTSAPTAKDRLEPYDCTPDNRNHPLQILDDTSIVSLDPTTGEHTLQWQMDRAMTTPPYINLNAADISSRDNHAYGVFALEGVTLRYLARFDQSSVEFVASFPNNCNLNAGGFDSRGNFFASCDSTYYRISRQPNINT